MTAGNNNGLDRLPEIYSNTPVIRKLAEAALTAMNPVAGTAYAIVDALLGNALSLWHARNLRIWFDQLAEDSHYLSQESINSEPFVRNFFATLTYALREESEEKVRLFARLLTASARGEYDTEAGDQFIELREILRELTRRELGILITLAELEANRVRPTRIPSLTKEQQQTLSYQEQQEYQQRAKEVSEQRNAEETRFWETFDQAVSERYGIPKDHIPGMLMRLVRTGTYNLRIGTYGGNPGNRGDLTPLYYQLAEHARLTGNVIKVNRK